MQRLKKTIKSGIMKMLINVFSFFSKILTKIIVIMIKLNINNKAIEKTLKEKYEKIHNDTGNEEMDWNDITF